MAKPLPPVGVGARLNKRHPLVRAGRVRIAWFAGGGDLTRNTKVIQQPRLISNRYGRCLPDANSGNPVRLGYLPVLTSSTDSFSVIVLGTFGEATGYVSPMFAMSSWKFGVDGNRNFGFTTYGRADFYSNFKAPERGFMGMTARPDREIRYFSNGAFAGSNGINTPGGNGASPIGIGGTAVGGDNGNFSYLNAAIYIVPGLTDAEHAALGDPRNLLEPLPGFNFALLPAENTGPAFVGPRRGAKVRGQWLDLTTSVRGYRTASNTGILVPVARGMFTGGAKKDLP